MLRARSASYLENGVRQSVAVAPETIPNILVTAVKVIVEVKQVEKISDGRAIERHIRIIVVGNRVRKIVPAAIAQRLQIPIPLDELQDR